MKAITSNQHVYRLKIGPVRFIWFRKSNPRLDFKLRKDCNPVDSGDWRVWRSFRFWRLWVEFRTSKTYSPLTGDIT